MKKESSEDVESSTRSTRTQSNKKVKVTLNISKIVYEKAHQLGLNVSKVAENCLIDLINAIEEAKQNRDSKKALFSEGFSAEKSSAGPVGFEPTTFSLEASKNDALVKSGVDWVAFRQSLKAKQYHGYYGSQLLNLCLQYSDCWVSRDLSKIKQLSPSMRSQTVKALSSLAKFQGCYEEYKQLLKNYGLTWSGRSADDLIIDRLNKNKDPENVFQWIRDVKEACPEYSVFMDFIAVTGLRLSEAIHSYNLIVNLSAEGALAEKYYNVKTGFIEHFRYREIFIRSCKKAFLSYVPLELLELIGLQKAVNDNHLKNRALERKHIPQRFSDVRENHASFTTKWLRPEEIDLLHGRVTGSVFMVHYYNPNLVDDLRSRVSAAAKGILVKVNSELLLKKDAGGDVIG